jgi:hypothetical protein
VQERIVAAELVGQVTVVPFHPKGVHNLYVRSATNLHATKCNLHATKCNLRPHCTAIGLDACVACVLRNRCLGLALLQWLGCFVLRVYQLSSNCKGCSDIVCDSRSDIVGASAFALTCCGVQLFVDIFCNCCVGALCVTVASVHHVQLLRRDPMCNCCVGALCACATVALARGQSLRYAAMVDNDGNVHEDHVDPKSYAVCESVGVLCVLCVLRTGDGLSARALLHH